MAHLPWSPTASERRVRRALASLTPAQRAICEAVAEGNAVASPEETDEALKALLAAYAEQD